MIPDQRACELIQRQLCEASNQEEPPSAIDHDVYKAADAVYHHSEKLIEEERLDSLSQCFQLVSLLYKNSTYHMKQAIDCIFLYKLGTLLNHSGKFSKIKQLMPHMLRQRMMEQFVSFGI